MQVLIPLCRGLFLLCVSSVIALAALPEGATTPDTIQLTNGEVLKGLIVRQTSQSVTIQLPYGERTVPNEDIIRIRNVGDSEQWFTRVLSPGTLPPWRVIANDLRNEDTIKVFEQIPATIIDEGVFKNVPYVSFRANTFYELNIYGDPDDPAGVEMGIYGPVRYNPQTRKNFRQFLGGYLTTVDEVRALYSMNLKKDESRQVGPIVMEVSQPTGIDAYGAWWISFYNPAKLNAIRLSDEEYKKLTLPVDHVLDRKKGIVKLLEYQAAKMLRKSDSSNRDRVFFEGFYRDKEGNFRLYESNRESPQPGSASTSPTPKKKDS